jgi:hypothetical protein
MMILDRLIKKTDKTVDRFRNAIDGSTDKQAIKNYYDKIDEVLKNFLETAKTIPGEENK